MPDTSAIHIQTCPCGLEVKYKDKHIGRTLPCSNCGLDITLRKPYTKPQSVQRVVVHPEPLEQDDAPFALEDPPIDLPGLDLAPPVLVTQAEPDFETDASESSEQRRARTQANRRSNGFWKDAGRAITYLRSLDAWVKTIVLIIMLTLANGFAFVPILGLLGKIIGNGIAITFYFNTIVHSSGGDDELPDFEWEGWWESGLKPIFTFLFITLVIFAPGFALTTTMPENSIVPGVVTIGMAFLWPVIMLMVALGGGVMALRIDLALRTIISAPFSYIAIWLLLIVAIAAQSIALIAGMGYLPDSVVDLIESPIIGDFFTSIFSVYLAISVMKIIGLYYRHFSDRFPWDAG